MSCLHCSKPIESKRNTKKYCSNTCKQYAYLNRNLILPSTSISISKDKSLEEISFINPQLPQPLSLKEERDEKSYEYIRPRVLEQIETASLNFNISADYFSPSSKRSGITKENFSAFCYALPRIRCIIDNLFQLSYKRKVYYNTIYFLYKALDEILLSEKYKKLPNDFPFTSDLENLHEQMQELTFLLKEDEEGIKFTLSNTGIVRYILILNMIRSHTSKSSFRELFPHLFSIKA